MNEKSVGSGGAVERTVWFLAGCMMAGIGLSLLYFFYRMTTDRQNWEYEPFYMVGCIGMAFFLLRGAWFTIMPEPEKDKIKMSHDR